MIMFIVCVEANYNGLLICRKKMDCKLFSLEENSDIEPISEEDDDSDEDKPICEVQVI